MPIEYRSDKPEDCRYCYFFEKQKCSLEVCHYVLTKQEPTQTECGSCPYGRAAPCIGWCTREVLRAVGLERGS